MARWAIYQVHNYHNYLARVPHTAGISTESWTLDNKILYINRSTYVFLEKTYVRRGHSSSRKNQKRCRMYIMMTFNLSTMIY